MQCKDISDTAILELLSVNQGEWHTWTESIFMPSVRTAFPVECPDKLIVAKMARLIERGLVGGCPCGCRGDYVITDAGLAKIGKPRTAPYCGY